MVKVKTGIIGLGGFGNFHLDNLVEIENAEVIALAADNKERLDAAGKKVPAAHLYEDYHEMFESEDLDAVIICVTPARHDDIEMLCCEKGVHFYVEKPLGLSEAKLVKINQKVMEAGIINAVGYQERYNPAIEEVKELIKDKPVGIAEGYWIGRMPEPLWWRNRTQSGGQVVEQATHIVDMLRYLLGEVVSVYAIGTSDRSFGGEEHDVEDCSTALLHFESGATAALQSANYLKNDEASKVGFRMSTPEHDIDYRWTKQLKVTGEHGTIDKDAVFKTHFASLQAFVNAVSENDPSKIRSDYNDGLKTCLVTLAINKSMETGQVVYLVDDYE